VELTHPVARSSGSRRCRRKTARSPGANHEVGKLAYEKGHQGALTLPIAQHLRPGPFAAR